ncbi:MAG: cell division control protein Cdc6 [Candidatus Aenigmatarchaeota archaeon]|nr:MAG: cell division control protein Cdc6 [Candidatus Aenigmarchaeota archaeon]
MTKQTQQTLHNIFSNYMQEKTNFFKNRDALSSDYIPDDTPHRDDQIKNLGSILAPTLRGAKASNIFLYGKTGTGKTVITKYVTGELNKMNESIKIVYINCKMKRVSDTEYRLLAELAREMGRKVPATGLPTVQVYQMFLDCLDEKKTNVILVLDEIDALVKKIGDGILYNLTRINQNLKNSRVSIIGISNDTSFTDDLDARVRSTLSEEEIIFPPYNAAQLQDILKQRAELAFHKSVVEPGVIEKCAALAAQEHGDARRALDLLRMASEIAERLGKNRVTIDCVDRAEDKLDLDRVVEIVKTQPKQSQAVLASIIRLVEGGKKNIETGDVFSVYERICASSGLKVLTQRRVSDLVAELDMLGIINAKVVSKGRYGRTKEIRLQLGKRALERIRGVLKENYLIRDSIMEGAK